jgi:hypothetical protein
MEISNLEDKQSRERRLNCLKKIEKVNFSPFGWSSIIKYEVIIQMIRIINSRKNELIQLKENIWKKIDPNSLLDYIEGNLDKLQTPRKLYEAASEIEEIFKPVRKKLGRSFDTKKIVDLDSIGKNDLEDAKNIIEHLRSVNKTDSASDMFFKKIYKSVKLTGSLSNALTKLLKIDDPSDIEKRCLYDASSLSVFYKLAREAIPYIAEINRLPESDVSKTIAKINPATCPGFSLRTVLLRALHMSYKNFKSSDWGDTDHIVYAPYVNIFFSDKTTKDFLRQETRNQAFRIDEALISNIRRIVPLNKLFESIFN